METVGGVGGKAMTAPRGIDSPPRHPDRSSFGGLGAAIAILVGAGGLIALLDSGFGAPALLGFMVLLAAIGTFAIFGWASGYLRMAEHASESELLRTLAGETDTAMQVVSREHGVLYSNRAFRRLLGSGGPGATIESALGSEPGAAEALYRLTRAAEMGEACHEDVEIRAGAGSLADLQARAPATGRWLRIAVRPFPPTAWNREHGPMVLWLVNDVTTERERDTARFEAMRRHLEHFETMPIGTLVVAEDGRLEHVNRTLADWLGPISEDGERGSLYDLVSSEAAEQLREASAKLGTPAHEGASIALDIELLRESGTSLPVRILLAARTGMDGTRQGGALGVVLDPTRIEGEAGTAESGGAARFSRFFRAAPFGMATLGGDGRIVEANAALRRMLVGGSGPIEFLRDMVAEGDTASRASLDRALARALEGKPASAPVDVAVGPQGEATRRLYVTALASPGRPRSEADLTAPTPDADQAGEAAALLFAMDTSEQRALEIKFAQSHKMEAIGKLAGGIAHDFNNVLTVIIMNSELLLQTRRPTDPGYNDLMQIKSNARRAAGMVKQLLAFSRKQTLEPEILPLNEVIQDFSLALGRLLGERVALKHAPGRELWYVKADRTQLEQVLMNLAVNARDAMPSGGTLTIRTDNLSERKSLDLAALGITAGEYVALEVSDSGTGMSAEVMAKIFDPFFTTKEVGKGTGLGLSTVYGIVKQTGGYIFADSEVGKGTTFRIYLPRFVPAPADLQAAKGAKRKEPHRDLTGSGRVLLVEDEDAVRSVGARALKRQGYTVLEASTGLEALEVMEAHAGQVDLVVSDVIMPEMDGPTMNNEMRKSNPDLQIVFVSGYPRDAFDKMVEPGLTFGFLPKPFTMAQLAAKVKEHLSH
jgi:two-component system cell cycle sensor histidine kinase/response regulator CckA